jgi:hypothetical protein
MAQFGVNKELRDPYKNFKFRVRWDGHEVAGISKVEPNETVTPTTQPNSWVGHGEAVNPGSVPDPSIQAVSPLPLRRQDSDRPPPDSDHPQKGALRSATLLSGEAMDASPGEDIQASPNAAERFPAEEPVNIPSLPMPVLRVPIRKDTQEVVSRSAKPVSGGPRLAPMKRSRTETPEHLSTSVQSLPLRPVATSVSGPQSPETGSLLTTTPEKPITSLRSTPIPAEKLSSGQTRAPRNRLKPDPLSSTEFSLRPGRRGRPEGREQGYGRAEQQPPSMVRIAVGSIAIHVQVSKAPAAAVPPPPPPRQRVSERPGPRLSLDKYLNQFSRSRS